MKLVLSFTIMKLPELPGLGASVWWASLIYLALQFAFHLAAEYHFSYPPEDNISITNPKLAPGWLALGAFFNMSRYLIGTLLSSNATFYTFLVVGLAQLLGFIISNVRIRRDIARDEAAAQAEQPTAQGEPQPEGEELSVVTQENTSLLEEATKWKRAFETMVSKIERVEGQLQDSMGEREALAQKMDTLESDMDVVACTMIMAAFEAEMCAIFHADAASLTIGGELEQANMEREALAQKVNAFEADMDAVAGNMVMAAFEIEMCAIFHADATLPIAGELGQAHMERETLC